MASVRGDIGRERLVMLFVWSLGALSCLLGLTVEPSTGLGGGIGERLLELVRVAAAAGLAITLLFGPGILWRAGSERRIGLAFTPLPGLAILIATGGLAWVLESSVDPKLICFAVFAPLLGLLLGALLAAGPEDLLEREEQWALLVVGCALGFAIARAIWSAGPAGELYGGTNARTLEVGDRSDARISYNVIQLIAHGTHPFSGVGAYYFAPYNFSSRGPLAGLGSAPIVFLSGGRPPLLQPTEPWQPFDPAGYMAYRMAMMTFASTAFVAVWDLTRRLGGIKAARVALMLAATTPFLVHEVWFTWPKMLTGAFVLLAAICVLERRFWLAGAMMGACYVIHPSGLLALSGLILIALWPLRGANWKRPEWKNLIPLLFGVAVAVVGWRLVNGHNYDQSGFLEYFQFAGSDFTPTPEHWLAYRAASFGNTFVPMLLPLAFPHNVSINVAGGISPFSVHFFFQYWDGLPFGAGIFFFPLLLYSLYKALRRWPWGVFAAVIVPIASFTIYWGGSHSGMLREGLQAWVLMLFVVVGLQQRDAGFNFFRSKPIRAILSLRAAELLLVALGPALATSHILISAAWTLTDLVAVFGMVGFAAALAILVWTTTPERLAAPDSVPPSGYEVRTGGG